MSPQLRRGQADPITAAAAAQCSIRFIRSWTADTEVHRTRNDVQIKPRIRTRVQRWSS